jgi:hypothetical protein
VRGARSNARPYRDARCLRQHGAQSGSDAITSGSGSSGLSKTMNNETGGFNFAIFAGIYAVLSRSLMG